MKETEGFLALFEKAEKAREIRKPISDILVEVPEEVKKRVSMRLSEVNPGKINYRWTYDTFEIDENNIFRRIVFRVVLVFISNILKKKTGVDESQKDNKNSVFIFDIKSDCETSFLCDGLKKHLVIPEGYLVEQLDELIIIYNI